MRLYVHSGIRCLVSGTREAVEEKHQELMYRYSVSNVQRFLARHTKRIDTVV